MNTQQVYRLFGSNWSSGLPLHGGIASSKFWQYSSHLHDTELNQSKIQNHRIIPLSEQKKVTKGLTTWKLWFDSEISEFVQWILLFTIILSSSNFSWIFSNFSAIYQQLDEITWRRERNHDLILGLGLIRQILCDLAFKIHYRVDTCQNFILFLFSLSLNLLNMSQKGSLINSHDS